MSLELGQRIQVDLFGMRVAGLHGAAAPVEVTVVGLAPGVVTVQLERDDGGLSEVTVSPGRIERAA
jgi:hypothetical protein